MGAMLVHVRNRLSNLRERLRPRSEFIAVFNHIPKTAGMSFCEFIKRNVGARRVVELYTADNRDRLHAFSQEEQLALSAIVGHLPISYFAYFEQAKALRHMTVLRDPVKRIASFYHYIRRQDEHYLHRKIVDENLSLAQFVQQQLTLECDNLQTRYLCTSDLSGVPIGSCTKEMLAEAKQNLVERFAFVGVAESFAQSLELAARTLAWRNTKMPTINVAPRDSKPLDERDAAAIRSANELDCELHLFAQELFQKRLNQQ